MISVSKKPHMFFERTLSNNLENLSNYLILTKESLLSGAVPNVDISSAKQARGVHDIGDKYNIFQFHNSSIHSLYAAIRDMTIEACEYYGLNFSKSQYMVQGWFNTDSIEDPELQKESHYHDHLGGTGIPNFHGYYCVNAEPSSTFYKIGGQDGTNFENINKNNRAILSETGHPHGIGPWKLDEPRVTIAYDVSPLGTMSGDKEQHWIPLV